MDYSTSGFTVLHYLLDFAQTPVHWVSDAIQPSHPLSSPSPPAPISPSIRVFSNESTLCMRWPKYWSFSFSIIPSKEIPGLISFRMDWLALLAVQGTLKSLLQHQSSKASILWRSAFFTVQLSHPYMTTGKTIALSQITKASNKEDKPGETWDLLSCSEREQGHHCGSECHFSDSLYDYTRRHNRFVGYKVLISFQAQCNA